MKKFKILLAATLLLAACSSPAADDLKLKEASYTYELGSEISLDPKDYLDEDTTEEILNDTTLAVYVVKDEKVAEDSLKDTENLSVGEYIFKLTHKDEVEEVNVKIQDTIAPEFVKFSNEVSFYTGDDVDLTQVFNAEDQSSVEIAVEGDVDFNAAGTYPVKFIATDPYGNSTEKECLIRVIKEADAEIPTPQPVSQPNSNGSSTSSSSNSSTSGSNSGSNSSSNSGSGSSSSSGSTTTPTPEPIPTPEPEPKPTPEPHQHKFIVNSTTTYYEGNELLFDNWDDANNKLSDIYEHGFEQSYIDKYGYWKNISVFGVRCANGCGELWYVVELTY